MTHLYEWRVLQVIEIIDGDTVDCIIDRGFGATNRFRFRLYGIDTPERGEPDFQRMKDFVKAWFVIDPVDTEPIIVRTFKSVSTTKGIGDGSFGRWLGDFYHGNKSLRAALEAEGYGTLT